MKNFRSSKNLRAVEPCSREESGLRMKVRQLEEQVELLQKSNLNIFIPISEQEAKNSPNYEAIISKLKTQILTLQQETQRQKTSIKKLEGEKELLRIAHQNELKEWAERTRDLEEQMEELREEGERLSGLLDLEKKARGEAQKSNIELRVENKFLQQDLVLSRKRLEGVEKKFEELHNNVLAVNFHTRIYNSTKVKVTAIETQELGKLKLYIEELEERLRKLMQAQRQETISLGVRKKDIGQEIVRLKQNIDLQLGLTPSSKTTNAFLQAYQQTNGCFDNLIKACRN